MGKKEGTDNSNSNNNNNSSSNSNRSRSRTSSRSSNDTRSNSSGSEVGSNSGESSLMGASGLREALETGRVMTLSIRGDVSALLYLYHTILLRRAMILVND